MAIMYLCSNAHLFCGARFSDANGERETIIFPCSADHEQDWLPFPGDPYSAESADDVVKTFPIRGPGTVECTRRVSLRDREYRVDVGKLVVTRKPRKRSSVAITDPSVLPHAPIILQPFSPIRIPVLALASLNKNR